MDSLCRMAQPTGGRAILRQVILGCVRKPAKCEPAREPESSIPSMVSDLKPPLDFLPQHQ